MRASLSRPALPLALALLCAACKPVPETELTAEPRGTHVRFLDGAAESGVSFRHRAGRSAEKLMPEIMGGGVAIADFNRDGAPDLLLINSGELGTPERPYDALNRLYINDGKGRFRDESTAWQLLSTGYGMGAAVGDFDNDGYVDALLTHFAGELQLLRNIDGGGFEDVSIESGLGQDGGWATSAGFFDFDNDGRLDLFVLRYLDFPLASPPQSFRNRILIYPTPLLFDGLSDQLWRNLGDGGFVDISAEAGIAQATGKGLALAIADIDKDGHAEIYVANDTDANQLWTRSESGQLQDIAPLAGAAFDEHGGEQGSMGADFSDIDLDGLADIAVSNFQMEVTSIYRQSSGMLFSEIADRSGVGRRSRQRLGFGLDFFDADNDGLEDLLVANGHIEDNIELNSDSVTFAQTNSLYLNQGNGRLLDITDQAGPALQDQQVSRGLATADLDGDGALDYVVVNNEGDVQLAFNRSAPIGNFVTLWLEGVDANRSAIGTRVVAHIGDRRIERQVMGVQSYLSVSDFRLHLGLADAEAIDRLEVHWPGGDVQIVGPLSHGHHYHLRQGSEPQSYIPGAAAMLP